MPATCFCTAPATTGQLCTAHASTLREELRQSIGVLRDLDVTITNQAKQGGNNGSGERMAFNETASDRRQDVVVVLRSAAQLADPQARFRYDESPAHLVARAWHLPGFQQLCRQPQVHIVAQDLHDALVGAERVMQPAEERIAYGVCPCGAGVSAPRWAEVTTCRGCGRDLDLVDWRAQMDAGVRAALPDREGTLRDVLAWLAWVGYPVNGETARKWVTREKLTPVGEGVPAKFRVGDIMALAEIPITLDKSRGVPPF